MPVPYTFGTATAAIPLSQLDSNFATAITLGNTAVYLGNTTTSIGNLTLTNVTISSGEVTTGNASVSGNVTLTGGTANGVAYLNTSKVLTTGSALVFNGTNLGINVTPSAWQANNRAIQLNGGYASLSGNSSQGTCDVAYNCYNTTSQAVLGWKYTNSSAAATLYQQLDGIHAWHIAPSGTADTAITFTQAMTLDASGRLGIGATAPRALLDVVNGNANSGGDYTSIVGFTGANNVLGSDTGTLALQSNDTVAADMGGSLVFGGRYSGAGAANWAIVKGAKENATSGNVAGYLVFGTRPSGGDLVERARIDSTGKFYSLPTYNNTTGAAANMGVDSTAGVFYRSTSSLKYKRDVQNYDKGLAEVMQLRSVYYKGTSERDGDTQYAGLIAEEVHEIGLTEFVQYAEDKTPDALAYGHMVSLLTKAIQELNAKFEEYKAAHP